MGLTTPETERIDIPRPEPLEVPARGPGEKPVWNEPVPVGDPATPQ